MRKQEMKEHKKSVRHEKGWEEIIMRKKKKAQKDEENNEISHIQSALFPSKCQAYFR